ncbi:hypothetical protein BDD26_2010 [Xenorhabdus cabanillasii]|uniref:Uncharacterized protein n=1 Tax=Xenorhabdus cabanillasii TaxID=351673 RepID=A0A3D9UFU2_9GAMM|nr:hypothetical protein BDD26_2010 [Xenorhabdus cabanillasii]
MEKQPIQGHKGGSQHPRTPVEAPDSLQSTSYTKILLALGEGEFAGELDGRRIFLDNTPLIGSDGRPNFEGVKWEFRPGTPHQTYIPGMPAVENARTVSAELASSWVTTVTNTQLSAVRLRRLTPKQNSNRIADAMMVEAITEVIDAKLSYPETALLFVQFDAKQFRNIPQIT